MDGGVGGHIIHEFKGTKVRKYESTKVRKYFRTFVLSKVSLIEYFRTKVSKLFPEVRKYESTSDEVSSDYNVYTINEL